jgi:hypothetical protein
MTRCVTVTVNKFGLMLWQSFLVAAVCILASHFFSETRVIAQTQANCDSYTQCPSLQGQVGTKLTGAITYSFDDAALSRLLGGDANKIKDFKDRFKAAADDWSQQTGVSITPAAGGSAGNITVTMSDSDEAQAENGITEADPNDSTRRLMTFSSEYWSWTAAGKDRLFSHELGHILGLHDVHPGDCPGVETIMRELGPGATFADLQLINGYTCPSFPNNCPVDKQLPKPPRPNPCDVAKAKAIQQHNPADDEGGGGGSSDPCYGTDTSCEPYYDPTAYIYWDYDDLPNGYVEVYITDVSSEVYPCDDCGPIPPDPDDCYDYSSYGSCF